MPRKTTVAKTAAKKTVAKKTTAPAKKTTAKKSASSKPAAGTLDSLALKVIQAIKGGEFDGHMAAFDDAITERINKQRSNATTKKTTPAKERAVSSAPRRTKEATVTPEPDKTYKVTAKFKKLAGAKVKFVRFKADDDSKGVVEMMVSKPGYPKGKRVVIPVSALTK